MADGTPRARRGEISEARLKRDAEVLRAVAADFFASGNRERAIEFLEAAVLAEDQLSRYMKHVKISGQQLADCTKK